LGKCRWAFVESLSCYGNPAACGPWNGKCAERSAYLEEEGLTEPRFPGDKARLRRAFRSKSEPVLAFSEPAAPKLDEAARRARMQEDMKRWLRNNIRARDFERER
jgi:hypothetical protein